MSGENGVVHQRSERSPEKKVFRVWGRGRERETPSSSPKPCIEREYFLCIQILEPILVGMVGGRIG
jgi:hypothetical protein